MNLRILLLLTSLSVLSVVHAQTEQIDTLLSADYAKELIIRTEKFSISVTARGLDGARENFYYTTSAPKKEKYRALTTSTIKDVKDLRVLEINGKKLEVCYRNADDDRNIISYAIPDPDNREVNSYAGSRSFSFNISLKGNEKSNWSLVTMGLGLGWVTPVNDHPAMNASMGRSLEWSWMMVMGACWKSGRNSIAFGLGLDWRNYNMRNGHYFYKGEDNGISLQPFESGVVNGRSRLLTFSLQVPVLYRLKFGHNNCMGFTVGPVLNFNTGGNLKTQYELDSKKYKISTGGIHQSPVTVDLFGAIHWQSVGVYARYAPMKVLRSSAGLDFQSFSTGIMIML
ncbi:MAG: hypothetical protein K2K97_02790 [Muribaculaceae bacterium]|nr:hypothetical protein [Muribaculaceae bacterium]